MESSCNHKTSFPYRREEGQMGDARKQSAYAIICLILPREVELDRDVYDMAANYCILGDEGKQRNPVFVREHSDRTKGEALSRVSPSATDEGRLP
jgi:hypothetical protein